MTMIPREYEGQRVGVNGYRVLNLDLDGVCADYAGAMRDWIGNGVLDGSLEDESLFGEFLRTPVSEGGVEPLVVEPPHVVVEVGA